MNLKFREWLAAYLFLLPFLLVLGIFFAYAAGRAIFFSFTDYNLFSEPNWVGLRNYINLFREQLFLNALRNTVLYAFIVTAFQTFGALIMASVLNNKLRGINFFRTAYYLPAITSSVVITLIFLWLFQRRGAINYLLLQAQVYAPQLLCFLVLVVALQVAQVLWERSRDLPASWVDPALLVTSILIAAVGTFVGTLVGWLEPREVPPVDFIWLQTRENVIPGLPYWLSVPRPLAFIMIQNIFTTIPTFMLMFLAALQDVPKSHYEAAAIDGATPVQQFFYITVPSVQPVTFLVVTLGLIGTLQVFDQVAIVGDAAPLSSIVTLAYFVYNRMFPGAQTPEVGFAAAAAIFLALFTLLIVLLQRVFISSEGN